MCITGTETQPKFLWEAAVENFHNGRKLDGTEVLHKGALNRQGKDVSISFWNRKRR